MTTKIVVKPISHKSAASFDLMLRFYCIGAEDDGKARR